MERKGKIITHTNTAVDIRSSNINCNSKHYHALISLDKQSQWTTSTKPHVKLPLDNTKKIGPSFKLHQFNKQNIQHKCIF